MDVAGALTHVTNFLYPPRCAVCGDRFGLANARRVCPPCLARVEKIPEPICSICGAPMPSGMPGDTLCALCLEQRPHFASARAIARYRPSAESDRRSLPSLIRRHKYGLDQSLRCALAEFLGDDLPYSGDDCDVVVPVPLHHRRMWWRGFNQAALLAIAIAQRLDLPIELGDCSVHA